MKTIGLKTQLCTITLACGVALAGCSSADKKPAETAKAAQADAAKARAVDAFEAGAKAPPRTGTLYSLARILMAQGRDPEALTVLDNLTQRYPDYTPAYNAKAECHLRAERTQEAIEALSAGLRRRPHDAVLSNNLGMIWFLEGRYEEALARFDDAAAAEPKEAMYVANQAMTLAMLGKDKQAEALYARVTDYANLRHNMRVLSKARQRHAAEAANESREPTARGSASGAGGAGGAEVDQTRAQNGRVTGP